MSEAAMSAMQKPFPGVTEAQPQSFTNFLIAKKPQAFASAIYKCPVARKYACMRAYIYINY
jgi:hypothetical protein